MFGLAYLAFAFVLFRGPMRLSDVEALLLTAFCAVHPAVLFRSASVLSDVPFAALSLGALVLADRVTQREGSRAMAIVCGILAGLSILTRTTGYPIVVGILAIAVLRKSWRQAALFGSAVAVSFGFLVWEKLSMAKAVLPAGWSSLSPAFRQTWLYYTDYAGFRKLSIVSPHVAGAIFLNQFLYLCAHLPGYFLSPLFSGHIVLLLTLTVVLLWMIVAGFVRTISLNGWKPIHVAAVFYVGVVLAWNYPDWDRFLIPFLPLFAASLWIEGKWIAGELSREFRSERRGATIKAVGAGFGFAALALAITWNFATDRDRRDLLKTSSARAELLTEKRQAYEWLRLNSPGDSRIIAAEDAAVYLYTGRKSMRHIAMLPIGVYEPEQMQSDLNHITDTATAIKAKYWFASSDDGDEQWREAKPQLAARLSDIEGALPELFHSSSGNVRIYDLGCTQNRSEASCSAADRVLFPEGNSSGK
jgi:hypothetical protein